MELGAALVQHILEHAGRVAGDVLEDEPALSTPEDSRRIGIDLGEERGDAVRGSDARVWMPAAVRALPLE